MKSQESESMFYTLIIYFCKVIEIILVLQSKINEGTRMMFDLESALESRPHYRNFLITENTLTKGISQDLSIENNLSSILKGYQKRIKHYKDLMKNLPEDYP